jgi:hypothetical protein
MLHVHGYPLNLWAEAVFAANYLKNRLSNRMLDDKTPYEAWFGYKPEVGHLRRWGCIVYAHIPKQLCQKLDSKSRKGILVGYDATPYVYRIYDPVKKVILSTRDCKIAENEFYNFAETSSAPKPPGCQPGILEMIEVMQPPPVGINSFSYAFTKGTRTYTSDIAD